jgi:phosphoribosylanthranilate isomerase
MALKTKVLVKNITNLSEARYCAGMGAHMLAFPAEYIDPKTYFDITGWVQGLEMVLDISSCSEIPSNLNEYHCHSILVRPDQLSSVPEEIISVIIKLKPSQHEQIDFAIYQNKISYIVAEGLPLKEIETLLAYRFAILVSLSGYTAQSLDDVLSWANGIALNGSEENKPGLKEYDHLSDIFEKLEMEE